MGQRQGVYKPNKFQIKMSNKISDYLKVQKSTKTYAHWQSVGVEAHTHGNELALQVMKYAKLVRPHNV